MTERSRTWGTIIAIVFVALAVPLAASNVFIIAFSHMNMTGDFPWGSYLRMGPSLVLAVLVVITSVVSRHSADAHTFHKMVLSLILLIGSLLMLFGVTPVYRLFVLLYSLAGILQIQKFWRYAAPDVPGRHLTRAMRVLVVALMIACAGLAVSGVQSIPKMPADKRGMAFIPGSLHFHDYWHRSPSLGKLAQDTHIQGMLFPKHSFVFFDDSGALHMAQLGEDTTIQGVRCAASPANVHFNKTGKLTNATLASDQVIDGKAYRKNDGLAFNEDGTISVLESETAQGATN